MDNSLRVVVNGVEFTKFKRASISLSLGAVASAFSFDIARENFQTGFSINDEIQIYINDDLTLTGKVNSINTGYTDRSHDVTISGFSNTFDLTKATIFTNPNYATPISFIGLVNKIFGDNSVSSVGVAGGFASGKMISTIIDSNEAGTSGDIGETLFSFLDRYAKKVGVILSTNAKGQLVIYDNAPVGSPIRLKNKRNNPTNKTIKSADYLIDYSNRMKKVIVVSQQEFEDDVRGEAEDSSVKSDGVKCILSENIVDQAGCTTQAKWEVNKRISDSVSYNCTVFGFSYLGTKYDINLLVDVDDDFAGVTSSMMIKDVEFNFSESGGSVTNLQLVLPDAYSQQTGSTNPTNSAQGQ